MLSVYSLENQFLSIFIIFYKSAFYRDSNIFQNFFSLEGFIDVAPTPRNGIGGKGVGEVWIPTPLPIFKNNSIYSKDYTNYETSR
jgi:hypothetical protein